MSGQAIRSGCCGRRADRDQPVSPIVSDSANLLPANVLDGGLRIRYPTNLCLKATNYFEKINTSTVADHDG
jgi:hypothetical protein